MEVPMGELLSVGRAMTPFPEEDEEVANIAGAGALLISQLCDFLPEGGAAKARRSRRADTAWSPLSINTPSVQGRPARCYEIQVCSPSPTPGATSSSPGSDDCRRRYATPTWSMPGPPVTTCIRRRRVAVDEPELIANAAWRFPELRRAGIRVKEPRSRDGSSVTPSCTETVGWYTSQCPRDFCVPDGAPPFRAGTRRPRLLERNETPMGPGESATNWCGGLRSTKSPSPPPAAPDTPSAKDVRSDAFSPADSLLNRRFSLSPPPTSPASGVSVGGRGFPATPSTPGSAQVSPLPSPRGSRSRQDTQRRVAELRNRASMEDVPPPLSPKGRRGRRKTDAEEQARKAQMQAMVSVVGELQTSVLARARNHPKGPGQMNRRLSQCRRRASFEDPSAHTLRDRLCRRQEVDLAQESFGRYFILKKENAFNAELLFEALADFGIRGRTRQEKFGLKELVDLYPKTTIAFGDFCTFVEDAKAKMRHLHSWATHQVWRMVDKEDHHGLPPAGVMQVMTDLGFLDPNDTAARAAAEALMADLTLDDAGHVSFEDAEYAIEDMRYYAESTKRRAERDIQKRFKLSDELFKEFRSQLQSLLAHFEQLDEDSSGSLDAREVVQLLDDFGFACKQKRTRTLQIVGRIAQGGELKFPTYLQVMRELRTIDMDNMREEVMCLFQTYDRDRSCELDMRETSAVLMALGLQPRTVREQQSMAELLEEVDKDGSGKLSFRELQMMTQRISERIIFLRRAGEAETAAQLGLSKSKVSTLRAAFEEMSDSADGTISVAEVERALFRYGVPAEQGKRLLQEVDEDGHALEFSQFLTLMGKLESERAAAAKRKSMAVAEPEEVSDSRKTNGRASPTSPRDQASSEWLDGKDGLPQPTPRGAKKNTRMVQGNVRLSNRDWAQAAAAANIVRASIKR